MTIWRLIAHHEDSQAAIQEMIRRGRIAIGWSDVGDLSKLSVSSSSTISSLISRGPRRVDNAHLGGPSLWNLYHHMQVGDLVILNADGKRVCVFEVVGPYVYESGSGQILGYAHQRPACETGINPEDLWSGSGSAVAEGQNVRWTLASCVASESAGAAVFREGLRYAINSTAIERSPAARAACIEHYGCRCYVCGFDFEKMFGELGAGYIHVHHRVEISARTGVYDVDPVKDLVPLCPNCHAMAHREAPAVSVERIKKMREQSLSR